MNISSKAESSVRWTAILSAFLVIIGLVQMGIIARFFSPEDFGTIAFLTITVAICDVFIRVGFSDALIASKNLTPRQLSTLFWINLLVGFAVYALLYLAAPLSSLIADHPQIHELVRCMGVTVLIGSVAVQFKAIARKNLRFKFLAFQGGLQALVALAVATYFAMNEHGVWSMVHSAIAAQVTSTVCLAGYAHKNKWLPRFECYYGEVKEQLKFGVFRIGASLLNNLNSRADQIAILVFLGPVELGYYSLAFNIAMKPFQKINPILTQVSFPIFASVSADKDKMRNGYRKGLRLLMAVNAPLLLGYVAIAPVLVPLVLGPNWEPVVLVSQILAIFALFKSAGNINIGLILANDKYRWPFYWNLFLFFLIPLSIFLVSAITESIVLVSCILALVQFALLVMGYFLFARTLLGPFGYAFIGDVFAPITTASVMAVGTVYLGTLSSLGSQYIEVATLIAIGAIIYLVFSMFTQRRTLSDLGKVILTKSN